MSDCGHEQCPDEDGRCHREKLLDLTEDYAEAHGGMKKDGTPFTREDASDIWNRVADRLAQDLGDD